MPSREIPVFVIVFMKNSPSQIKKEIFIDYNTMPRSKQISFIVKISACLMTFFILFFTTTVFSADVTLTWDRPNDCRVAGYEIYYGPAENDDFKSSPKEIIPSPAQTNRDIIGLIPGQSYAFVAKSYDRFGNKSDFSETIYYDVPDAQDERSSGGGGGGCFIQHISNLNVWDK